MRDRLIFALLPTSEKRSASLVRQQHGAALAKDKVRCLEHAVIYYRQHEPVRHARAQLLHQVERQRLAPRPVAVQEADIGVQSHTLERGGTVVREQTIGKREQRVERVERRAAAALVEEKRLLLPQDHLVEHAEIGRGPGALQPAQALKRRFGRNLRQKPLQLRRHLG